LKLIYFLAVFAGEAVLAGFMLPAGAIFPAGFILPGAILLAGAMFAGGATFTGATLTGGATLAGLTETLVFVALSPQAMPSAPKPRTVESKITFFILFFLTPVFSQRIN
jgi:hypothetical protein